jgi:SAM-dependent methyltransferase
MRLDALQPYEQALSGGGGLSLVGEDGTVVTLAIERYLGRADSADLTVLGRCVAPVLDIGCGPGRMVCALTEQGTPALGIDIADYAVQLTHQRGGIALSRDVFDRVPGEGRWPTILVLDGNIGIGGNVAQLLNRLVDLMASHGTIIVEASSSAPGIIEQVLRARFARGGEPMGPPFTWSVVSADAIAAQAGRCGLAVSDHWSAADRSFLCLSRRTDLRRSRVIAATAPVPTMTAT